MAVYRTKVDAWLALLVGAGLAVGLVACLAAGVSEGVWWPVGLMLVPVLLVALLTWPTEYALTDEELVVRSGVVRYRVPLSEVCSVAESREPWSAPAWSMDRLKIVHGKGKVILISPKAKSEFLADFVARVRARQGGA